MYWHFVTLSLNKFYTKFKLKKIMKNTYPLKKYPKMYHTIEVYLFISNSTNIPKTDAVYYTYIFMFVSVCNSIQARRRRLYNMYVYKNTIWNGGLRKFF